MIDQNEGFPSMSAKRPHEDEVDALAEQVRYHNERYWVSHKPEISDPEYDRLIERLRALAPNHPILDELVEDNSGFKKVKHEQPMLSIEKVFEPDDVISWAEKAGAIAPGDDDGITASFKVDGSSCSLIYEDGKLLRAATRGNGVSGDDITRNAKMIDGIPHSVAKLKGHRVEIRGEIYMSIAAFKEALARIDKAIASGEAGEDERPVNPRNYCAGSLKQKDSNITKERKLSFMAHGCFGDIPGSNGKSDSSNMAALAKLGFEVALYKTARSHEEIRAAITEIEAQRKDLPYEIDGVVFCVNRLGFHADLGYTSHHPRFKLAFKFGRDRGETSVENILWETSRSGRVCPTMVVKPIPLGGATVTNCTVHNAKTVRAVGLTKGDKVLLEREVIPYFVQKLSPEPAPSDDPLPKKCPSCGSELAWDETETNLLCLNQGGCAAQLQDFLEHYCSRGVTNIMGVGPELLRKLMDKGLLKSPADLYELTPQVILDNVERQGDRSAQKAVDSIQSHREQTLETFLTSLGIRGLGPSVAQRLVTQFGSLDAIRAATEEQMLGVEKFAETMANTLVKGLKERSKLIDALLKHVTVKQTEKVEGLLTGKSFCLTGHVEFDFEGMHYDARPDIETLIKSKGGAIKSVSKGLSYLVAGDESGSKIEKAKKANIPIIDANGLLNLLAGKEANG